MTLYQILLAAPFVLDLTFPKSYSAVMAAFSIIGLNVAEDSGMTCLWRMDYVDELIVQTLLPFCIATIVGVSYMLHTNIHSYYSSTASYPERLAYLKSLYSQVFLTLTYLLVPSTVTSIFRMFPCQNVDPDDDADGADWYMRVCAFKSFLFDNWLPYLLDFFVCRRITALNVRQTDTSSVLVGLLGC